MELKFIQYNKEKIFQFSVYGQNRDPNLLGWQKKVFDKFGYEINQIYIPFEAGYSHGQGIDIILNTILAQTKDVDHIVIWDDDAIPLRKDYLEIIYSKIKDKMTLFGVLEQSNHVKKFDGTFNHPYVGTSPFCISVDLYRKLGSPTFNHIDNVGDRAEYISFLCEEKGYCIAGLWPKNIVGLNEEEMKQTGSPTSKSPLGQGKFLGFGCVYGENFSYHQMCAPAKRHSQLFIEKCQQVLDGKFD